MIKKKCIRLRVKATAKRIAKTQTRCLFCGEVIRDDQGAIKPRGGYAYHLGCYCKRQALLDDLDCPDLS